MKLFIRKERPPEPNSIVIRRKGEIYEGAFEYCETASGIPYRYADGVYYLLMAKQNGDGAEAFSPLPRNEEIVCLPESVKRALRWPTYKRILMYKPSRLEKINMYMTVAFFGIAALTLFLIVVSIAG
jgi:hypothetical protein